MSNCELCQLLQRLPADAEMVIQRIADGGRAEISESVLGCRIHNGKIELFYRVPSK